jgi:hypothetical protein
MSPGGNPGPEQTNHDYCRESRRPDGSNFPGKLSAARLPAGVYTLKSVAHKRTNLSKFNSSPLSGNGCCVRIARRTSSAAWCPELAGPTWARSWPSGQLTLSPRHLTRDDRTTRRHLGAPRSTTAPRSPEKPAPNDQAAPRARGCAASARTVSTGLGAMIVNASSAPSANSSRRIHPT